jgi:hypothetical protein
MHIVTSYAAPIPEVAISRQLFDIASVVAATGLPAVAMAYPHPSVFAAATALPTVLGVLNQKLTDHENRKHNEDSQNINSGNVTQDVQHPVNDIQHEAIRTDNPPVSSSQPYQDAHSNGSPAIAPDPGNHDHEMYTENRPDVRRDPQRDPIQADLSMGSSPYQTTRDDNRNIRNESSNENGERLDSPRDDMDVDPMLEEW